MLTPGEFQRQCLCQALRRAARKITRDYEAAYRSVGLTAGQFSILAALSGDAPKRLGEIAAALGLDRTTLTRDLKPLKRRGLIEETTTADARVRALSLSKQGRALFRTAAPLWRAAQAAAKKRLAPLEIEALKAALDKV
ncbi:MAG: winged helix-turn-helix transcriptional regulator [Hydrogenophilaceae bacterium]|jgi:DNA-binding MarR family transcriptional regulator|nr:winged helix-turn-helix transcriptional regulator [Hydrogenophilaceae bacterium]